MNTTLVINPKGGSGKTTIAINLASHFAAAGVPTTLMDFDPQGSSLNWLRLRDPHAPRIHAANAARQKGGRLRSMAMFVPPDTRQLVIDAPAGATGVVLQEMLERADRIILPVPASALDIHATANFMQDVLFTARMRARNLPLAVVANKVRRTMPRYQPLEWLLNAFDLALLARLIDSDVYVKAAESGVGIFEMEPGISIAERRQFEPIAHWVQSAAPRGAAHAEDNVYALSASRIA